MSDLRKVFFIGASLSEPHTDVLNVRVTRSV